MRKLEPDRQLLVQGNHLRRFEYGLLDLLRLQLQWNLLRVPGIRAHRRVRWDQADAKADAPSMNVTADAALTAGVVFALFVGWAKETTP